MEVLETQKEPGTCNGSAKGGCCCDNPSAEYDHVPEGTNYKIYLPAIFSFILLIIGLILDHFLPLAFFTGWIRIEIGRAHV